ncbi:hypothetical protein KGM_215655 [Danaus plexippus plexippus]|uniref:Protein rolling stone-like n=1 Tax=Danaus plexippus plexippus TaxID=278856 RepID=A0A212EQ06_DANPL|nr:hypothetical protein KGM_215655 [Danaus plexippus plexippus]
MGRIKNYFKEQFQIRKFKLEHDSSYDFYESCFQNNRSALPLLIIRGLLFLACLGIILVSFILTSTVLSLRFWPIYLTHWGLVLITVASGFGFAVSAKAFYGGPVDQEFAVSYALDILIHAVNSVLMLVLLFTASHPSNLLHFYFAIILAVIYVIFNVIYYFAGGTDPFGNAFIYPVLDWSNPGVAGITVVFSAILIIILHIIVTLMTEARDAIARSCGRNTRKFSLSQY